MKKNVFVITCVLQELFEFNAYPVCVAEDWDTALKEMEQDIADRFDGAYETEEEYREFIDSHRFDGHPLLWEYEDGDVWYRYFIDERELIEGEKKNTIYDEKRLLDAVKENYDEWDGICLIKWMGDEFRGIIDLSGHCNILAVYVECSENNNYKPTIDDIHLLTSDLEDNHGPMLDWVNLDDLPYIKVFKPLIDYVENEQGKKLNGDILKERM